MTALIAAYRARRGWGGLLPAVIAPEYRGNSCRRGRATKPFFSRVLRSAGYWYIVNTVFREKTGDTHRMKDNRRMLHNDFRAQPLYSMDIWTRRINSL